MARSSSYPISSDLLSSELKSNIDHRNVITLPASATDRDTSVLPASRPCLPRPNAHLGITPRA